MIHRLFSGFVTYSQEWNLPFYKWSICRLNYKKSVTYLMCFRQTNEIMQHKFCHLLVNAHFCNFWMWNLDWGGSGPRWEERQPLPGLQVPEDAGVRWQGHDLWRSQGPDLWHALWTSDPERGLGLQLNHHDEGVWELLVWGTEVCLPTSHEVGVIISYTRW